MLQIFSLSFPWLFHAWFIMLAVSINFPFGHFFPGWSKAYGSHLPLSWTDYLPCCTGCPKNFSWLQIWERKAGGSGLGSRSCRGAALCGDVIRMWLCVGSAQILLLPSSPSIPPGAALSLPSAPCPCSQVWHQVLLAAMAGDSSCVSSASPVLLGTSMHKGAHAAALDWLLCLCFRETFSYFTSNFYFCLTCTVSVPFFKYKFKLLQNGLIWNYSACKHYCECQCCWQVPINV